MDVRCTKCGIEYEFDDAKVTSSGVTVKCTSCGHVFKVKREEPATVPASFSTSFRGDGEWMVKQQGGTVYRFKELTTLQKWIVERKVSRDDEISKTGKTWKRLGEIAELASFFQVVDAANAALQASIVPVQPAMSASGGGLMVMPPTNPGAQVGAPPSTNPGFPATTPSPMDPATMQGSASSPTIPSFTPPGGGAASPQPPAAQPVEAAARPAPPQVPVRPAPVASSDALDGLDEDDPVLQWQKSKRRRLVAITTLLVIAAIGGVGFVFRHEVAALVGPSVSGVPPAAVEAARAALRDDRGDTRRQARAAIDAAAAGADAPALAIAWQARFEAADAAERRSLARVSAARALIAPTDAATHEAAARDANAAADEGLARAYRLVGDVRAKSPPFSDVHLAAAAYQLEKGGFAEMRADLESARAAAKPDELAVVDGEIAVLQALADAHGAATSADASVLRDASTRVPASDDGRLRMAKAELAALAIARAAQAKAPSAAAEIDAARALAKALPTPDARADALQALLDAAAPVAAPAVDAGVSPPSVSDAGAVVAVVDAGIAAAVPDKAPPDKAPPDKPVDDGSAADSYDVVLQKAERARVNEKSRSAYELFGKATKMKPGAARPWIGLGWAAMDLGKNAEAVKAFKRAVDLGPGAGEAHFGLAEAYRYTGQKEKAVAEYEEFLRVDPGSRDADVARRAIETLKE